MDLGEETITAFRDRLDVTRSLSFVSESLPETLHRVVDALVEFDEGIGWPEAFLKLFLADDLTGPFEED
jgi:hypothetical protein